MILVLTYNEIEKEQLTEAQQVSLAEAVCAKEDDGKENIASVRKQLFQEDPNTRLEPKSHKESLKEKNDDDDDDDDDDQHNVDALIRKKKKGSSEVREEEKQTLIPTPPRSPRTNLSLDKELNVDKLCSKIATTLDEDVPKPNHVITLQPTSSSSIPDLRQQVYMRMKNDPHSQAIDPNIWKVLKAKFEKSSTPSKSCKHNVFCKRDHDDHLDDYAPCEGEKGTKNQKTTGGSKSTKNSYSLKQPVIESRTTSFV
ncbi:hypothetical protein Tco_0613056 [Tanacetum coccineum]